MESVNGSTPKVKYPRKLVRILFDQDGPHSLEQAREQRAGADIGRLGMVLGEDLGYEGWWVDVWVNAPNSLWVEFDESSGDVVQRRTSILKLWPAWAMARPNLDGEDDEPLPRTPEGVGDIPNDILQVMLTKGIQAVKESRGLGEATGSKSTPTPAEGSGDAEKVLTFPQS